MSSQPSRHVSPSCRVRTQGLFEATQSGRWASQGRRRCPSALACSLVIPALRTPRLRLGEIAKSKQRTVPQEQSRYIRSQGLLICSINTCVLTAKQSKAKTNLEDFYWFLHVAIALETGNRSGNKTKNPCSQKQPFAI